MNKGKKLLILFLVLAVLVGGLFVVRYFLPDDTADVVIGTEPVAVQAMKAEDIRQIEYLFGDEKITLVKQGDTWKLSDDPAFPVDQAIAGAMASDSADLSALRLVSEKAEDFAEYGLSEPDTAYLFTLQDGTQVTYFLGNYNNFGGTYYMNVAGTNQIYLIAGDFAETFDHGLSDLADVPEMDKVTTEDVHGLSITLDGKTTKIFQSADGLPTVYSDKFTWFFDEKTPADSVAAHDLVGKAVSFSGNGCASYKADAAQLSSFGFDEPLLTAVFDYTVSEEIDTGKKDEDDRPITQTKTHEETLTLLVGGKAKDGSSYAKTDRSDTVYLLAPDYLQTLTDFDYASLHVADVCAVQSTDVVSMDVSIDGKTSTITVTKNKSDSGADEIVYALDGKQITPSKFNDFFTSVQTMMAEDYMTQETPMDDAPIVIVYHTSRKGFETMTLRLKPADGSFYVADLNGEGGKLVNKRAVEKLIRTFEALGES